ncbi:protein phosphatase [Vigna unguiculata]|uniref:protein-serine/threonine phosphatase n=1 Tax=Vigna unguiculata TaxID=3917 RepID=A0A4D6NUF9_VIGUN|nr:protein phosphatase [Vigna unguiculata]
MSFLNSILSAPTQVQNSQDAIVSGGGLSHNGKFSYGYASSPGKRSSMEDFYDTRIDGVNGEIVGLFGVFDGHGGARAAEYVKKNLFSNLISHPKFISDTKSAISDAYNHTDSEFLKSENNQNKDAGSTASTAILVGDRLLVANVGDSRAVICRGGNAIAVSRDHKPDQTDERQRIEEAGGFVMWAGTWRVGGVLAVSRAFGDRLLKQYVVADPEIQEEKVDKSLEFLILASDGLWDVVSNEEAVTMIKPIEDAEESAKRLMQEAYGRGSADNITCVVVRFLTHHGTSTHSSSGGNNGTAHGTSGGNHGPSHGNSGGSHGPSHGTSGGNHGPSHGTSGGNHGTSHGSSGGNLGPSHGSSGVSHGTSHGNSGGIHGPSHGSSGGNHVTSSHGSSGGNHGPSSHGSSGGGNKNLPNAGYK